MIYLDHASHTPACAKVLAEFCRVEQKYTANPQSAHDLGKAAKAKLIKLTEDIATLLGAKPEEVLFTSGATEANNIAISTLAHAGRHIGKHIITNALEHPSVSAPIADLQNQGYEIEMADILPNGTVDLNGIRALLRPDTVLLTVPWIDSELGAIQPVQELLSLLKDYPNCRLHVDAAQAAGKFPVSFSTIDTLSISPHKFNGVCGIGVLLSKEAIKPSGTPPLALVASTYTALKLALQKEADTINHVKHLRNHVIESLKGKVHINSPLEGSPYILNLSISGFSIKGVDFQSALNKHGICVSVKSACSVPGTLSRPVFAVSRNKKNALASWRISFSHLTTMAEVETFVETFNLLYKELQ